MCQRLILLLVGLVLFACAPGDSGTEVEHDDKSDTTAATSGKIRTSEKVDSQGYFIATGVEPFWGLSISESKVTFQSMIDGYNRFVTPHTEPVRVQDANIKRYNIRTESVEMQILISQGLCINSMSGDSAEYGVEVRIKRSIDTEFKEVDGCGKYNLDYRLHDIWVLESLRGQGVTTDDFAKELPYIEINAAQKTFMGYTGCNQISGSLFTERNLLRFEKAITTLKACARDNKEPEVIQALQASTHYNLGELRLRLSNPDGETMVFKKVD